MNKHCPLFLALSVFMTLNAQHKAIESIHIFGNTRTKPHTILRELDSKRGELFSYSKITSDLLYLKRLDFLRRIDFIHKSSPLKNQQSIFLIVREKSRFSISPLLDWDDMNGPYGGAGLTLPNLFGNRETLQCDFNFGGIQEIDLQYQMPCIAGANRLFIEIGSIYKKFEYLYPDFDSHMQTKYNFIISIGSQWSRKVKFGLSSQLGLANTSKPKAVWEQDGEEYFRIYTCFIRIDGRDWPIYPQSGNQFLFIAGQKFFGHTQKSPFMDLEYCQYHPIRKNHIIALQIAAQSHWADIPVYERIHFGGSSTIRGIAAGSLYGDRGILTTLEYRFPIFMQRNPVAGIHFGWAGVIFLDAGSVWIHDAGSPGKNMRWAIGCGAHAIWDQWIIRLEYANNGDDWGYITAGSGIKF